MDKTLRRYYYYLIHLPSNREAFRYKIDAYSFQGAEEFIKFHLIHHHKLDMVYIRKLSFKLTKVIEL